MCKSVVLEALIAELNCVMLQTIYEKKSSAPQSLHWHEAIDKWTQARDNWVILRAMKCRSLNPRRIIYNIHWLYTVNEVQPSFCITSMKTQEGQQKGQQFSWPPTQLTGSTFVLCFEVASQWQQNRIQDHATKPPLAVFSELPLRWTVYSDKFSHQRWPSRKTMLATGGQTSTQMALSLGRAKPRVSYLSVSEKRAARRSLF